MGHDDRTSALFISDLHLSEAHPETTSAFRAFLAGPARDAEAVYILGDLFEYWPGDDDASAPLNQVVRDALGSVAASGVAVYFLPGNRDFLLGDAFARDAGIVLIEDPTVVKIAGRRVLVTHGDALCTDDRAYQAYRAQVRDREWQRVFLNRPLAERKAIIENLRRQSEAAKRVKAVDIMDVNRAAVEQLLRDHDYPSLVHGHTHRPAHHVVMVDGRRCDRWVLEDWHEDAPYLRWDASGPSVHRHSPTARRARGL